MRSLLNFILIVVCGYPFWAAAQIPQPGDAQKPLSPEETVASYRLADGFQIQCVAAEPWVQSPSGVCWSAEGDLYVSELHGYNLEGQLEIEELNRSGKLDTEVRRVQASQEFKEAALKGTYGVIKRLRDSDGDRVMDHMDVLSDRLPPVYGMVPYRGGLIVACAPDIVYLADRDGDGFAEVNEKLFTGFRLGPLERGINAPRWGADGWVYFGRGAGGGLISGPNLAGPVNLPGSNFRIRPDGSAIEPVLGATSTFGFTSSQAWDWFTISTTTLAVQVAPIDANYLKRNPDYAAPGLQRVSTVSGKAYPRANAHPWRVKRQNHPEYFEYYRSRYGASDSDASGWFTSGCSPLIYRDSVLPGLQGAYLACDPAQNLIFRGTMQRPNPADPAIEVRRFPEGAMEEFAASEDAWSHPMALSHGPDGAVWVVDFYREIIEDYSAIPRHLQQQYGLYAGNDRGRIYRITHRDAHHPAQRDLSVLCDDQLAVELESPILWRRMTAQRLLRERSSIAIAPILKGKISGYSVDSLLVALPLLSEWNEIDVDSLTGLLNHPSAAICRLSLKLLEAFLLDEKRADSVEAVVRSIVNRLEAESDPATQIQIALTLGQSQHPESTQALVQIGREKGSMRWMDAALVSSLYGRESEVGLAWIRDVKDARDPLKLISQIIWHRQDPAVIEAWILALAKAPEATQSWVMDQKPAPKSAQNEGGSPIALATLSDVLGPKEIEPFLKALQNPKDLKNPINGNQLFTEQCSICHRLGGIGVEVGPDILGEVSQGAEALALHILSPGLRIRPGFETFQFNLKDGSSRVGILRNDGVNSVSIVLPGGAEESILRKDIKEQFQLEGSLMPGGYSKILDPDQLASLIQWVLEQR